MDFEPHLDGDLAAKTVTLTLNRDAMSELLTFLNRVEDRSFRDLIDASDRLSGHMQTDMPPYDSSKPHNHKKNEAHREYYQRRNCLMHGVEDVAYVRRTCRHLRIDLEEAMLEWMEGE